MAKKLGAISGCLVLTAWAGAVGVFGAVPHAYAETRELAGVAASGIEEKEFKDISDLYAKGLYEESLKRIRAFQTSYPKSPYLFQSENIAGLCFLLTKRPGDAAEHFRKAIQPDSRAHVYNQHVLYNLARAEHEAGSFAEAEATLAKIDPQGFDKDNRIKFHYLKASLLLKRAAPGAAAGEILAAASLQETSDRTEVRSGLSRMFEQSLQQMSDPSSVEDLYRRHENGPFADAMLYRLATLENAQGQPGKARNRLQLLINRFPQSEHAARATTLLALTNEPDHPSDGAKVGILLPLKGKFAKFGAKSLQGIQMAFRIFEENKPDSRITLVIEDSGDEPETAVRALNRLVAKHHVVAVIGPLLAKGIDQVTKRAEELRVPLLSLARQTGTPGQYALSAGITLELQSYEVARYAIQKLGMKRFAIVAPRDKVGEEFTQYFWNAVEAFGGQITGYESYNPGETDFRQAVDRLSGLYYTEARSRELEELAKLREKDQIKKRTRKTEQYYMLKPIVDYDAVFIPDEPKIAGQILPTFAYRDVDGVKFLGPSAWNSPELYTRAQNYSEKAFFAEGFYPDASSHARKFVDQYKAVFGQEPSIMEAAAYDAAALLETVLTDGDRQLSRAEVLRKLKSIRHFPGATGMISFDEGAGGNSGQFARGLKILTVKQGQIVPAQQ